jgi:dienelactone hydrolase
LKTTSRLLRWCGAALVLASCGGAQRAATHDPFAYDASAPLAIADNGVYATSSWATIRSISFAGVGGSRVESYVVAPRTSGRHPAVLFLHGSGGDRRDLIFEAALLAKRSAVTMTISQPNDVLTYRPLVVDARRALDVLDARSDVDSKRLGVVGFSLGAQTAAILVGDDRRPKAAGIIGGRGTDVARYWIQRTHADLFFQAGTDDAVVPHAQLVALERAAPDHPRVRWYDAAHVVNASIRRDQLAWQATELGLG